VKGSAETPVLLKTLQAIECSAVVLVDGIPDSIVNAHQSRHILYINKPVSMQDVLNKSTFAILNGGINSVSLFMKAGIPVALFPLHVEQFLMAKRVEALNAGIQLNLSDLDSALQGLQKVNSRQKKVAAGLFEEKYQSASAHNELLLQLALVEQNFLFEKQNS
jgi:UDP:flavonoid glycosyltransferase YjiC (YdhE family)